MVIEGGRSARGLKLAIVAARFNAFVVERLIDGATQAFSAAGGDAGALTIVRCPGSFELPLVAKRAAESGAYDAIVCLGCVIRGGTPHFEYVAGEAARGLVQAALETRRPIVFGVLTTNTIEQALERAGVGDGASNKGAEAVDTAVEMVRLLEQIGGA